MPCAFFQNVKSDIRKLRRKKVIYNSHLSADPHVFFILFIFFLNPPTSALSAGCWCFWRKRRETILNLQRDKVPQHGLCWIKLSQRNLLHGHRVHQPRRISLGFLCFRLRSLLRLLSRLRWNNHRQWLLRHYRLLLHHHRRGPGPLHLQLLQEQ